MATNKKISELTSLSSMTGSEVIPVAYSGANYTTTPYPFMNKRNLVDNPSFIGWARGTTFASTSSVVKAADRWGLVRGSTATGATLSRQTGSAGDPSLYYARLARDSANASTTVIYMGQAMESADSYPYAGKTLSASFYARKGSNYSATSDLLSFTVSSGTGSDQSLLSGFTGQANVSNTVTLTTSWQRFKIDGIAVPSNITQLGFMFHFTPTGTAGAADYVEIANVQVEESPYATIFVPEPMSVHQEKFTRFYQSSYATGTTPGAGEAPAMVHWGYVASGRVITWVSFSKPLRATPTVATYRTSHATGAIAANVWGDNNTAAWTNASSVAVDLASSIGFRVTCEGVSFTALTTVYNIGFNWTADADLV